MQTINQLEYVMGFLYADGCLTYNRGRYPYLRFAQKERETVERVMDVLRPHLSNRGGTSQLPNGVWQFEVYLKHNEVDLFTKYGIIPRKSYSISFPEQWSIDFLRGWIEGDGYWYIDRPSTPAFRLEITNAHAPVLQSLHDWLREQKLVKGGGVYMDKTAFCLRFNTHDAIRLSYALYSDLTETTTLSVRKFHQALRWQERWDYDPEMEIIRRKD